MRALTVQQPWAWAIVHGGKDVENRTQAWSYRGQLLIHAGARLSARGLNEVPELSDGSAWLGDGALWFAGELVLGAVIGVVDLVAMHGAETGCCDSRWGEQQYDEHGGRTRRDIVHLVLERPRPLAEPVPCRGALGLWTPPPDVVALVSEQLPVTTTEEAR